MIHLHRHSEYSRLDGVGTAQQYAERAVEMGQPALALTDHGTLSGALHHIAACRKAGIIPISGVEAYYRPDRSIRDKDQRSAWHLCLFAKNLKGWHSLLKITSKAYEDNQESDGGFYQHPCVDMDLLRRHREGLICSTACISGWLCHAIKLGDDVGANQYLTEMKDIFGDDLWLEIMPHDFEEQKLVNIEIANLANDHSLPIIATSDAHFPYQEWAATQQVAKLLSTKSSFQKEAKRKEKGDLPDEGFAKLLPTAYLMTEQQMRDIFRSVHVDLPKSVVDEAIANTHELAHSTTPFFLDQQNKMPKVTKTIDEAEDIIWKWCREGMERYGRTGDAQYEERLEFEFGVLKEKKVCDYFVMVGRLIRWCREEGIYTWLRGSAAGCLVSYMIGISVIDPIPYGFLFERFLNPGRKGMPDIDIDVEHERRSEVKQYLVDEYGADHVADIISHSTFQPKLVITDVARVFDIPYTEVEELNKTIDIRAEDDETTLEQIRPINDKLDAFAKKYPEVWKHAIRLEGTVANSSKHAAGVVITDKPVAEYMGLERGKKGDLVTSWSDRADFAAVSDHGFMKLDVLGVKGLTKQRIAVDLIRERHGVEIDLDDMEVLRDPNAVDPKVMEIFQKGLTLGIWQFGGRGITQLLKQIKSDWVGDLIAANALYRPGPMGKGVTWEYADLKQMPSDEIVYWHESIQFALIETFGIIAYQEQVMEICKTLGGFTPGQADDMRKAMGKLYRLPGKQAQEFMQGFKSQWDTGIKERAIDRNLGQEIWDKILSFGGYGFNKSHAGSYALQAYRDGLLKAYYPAEFYCALLQWPSSTTQKNADEKARFIQAVYREAEALNVTIAPPDINVSGKTYSLPPKAGSPGERDVLRFGLSAILDVGKVAADAIVAKRPFESWEDFTRRVPAKQCNSKVRTALIESGAADCFDMRAGLSGQEIIAMEKNRLGVALTMTGIVEEHQALIRENIWEVEEFDEAEDGTEVIVGGDVLSVSKTTVKRGQTAGQEMAFVDLALGVNVWRCTFFPGLWNAHQKIIESGEPIMVAGKKDTWRGTSSVKVNAAITLTQWIENLDREDQEARAA